jgi:hypothetical protein
MFSFKHEGITIFLGFMVCFNHAFTLQSTSLTPREYDVLYDTKLFLQDEDDSNLISSPSDRRDSFSEQVAKMTKNTVRIGLMSAALTCIPFVPYNSLVYAEGLENMIQPPKTALIIETSQKQGIDETVLKAKIDGKALAKTLIKNRKEITSSFNRIVDFTSSEIRSGPWLEIGKELLDFEGDVVPTVKVKSPEDVPGAFKDLASGKLDIIVNGEILYIDVQETKGSKPGDDEITIRIKGTRASLPEVVSEPKLEQIDPGSKLRDFLDAPFGEAILPQQYDVTNGQALLVGTTVGVSASYVVSYQYYLNEIAKQEEEAKAKASKKNVKKKSSIENKVKDKVEDSAPITVIQPKEDPYGEAAQEQASVSVQSGNNVQQNILDTSVSVEESKQSLSTMKAVKPEVDDDNEESNKKRGIIRRLFRRG